MATNDSVDKEDAIPPDFALVCLILLVLYMPQLGPELPDDAPGECWQGTEEFEDDFAYINPRAKELWSYLQSQTPEINKLAQAIEELIWDHVEKYQGKGKKYQRSLRMNFVCICTKHSVMNADPVVKSSEDVLSLEECSKLYADWVEHH